MASPIYTAEDPSGETFAIGAWPGLTREKFRDFVLERLDSIGAPNPDDRYYELDLCEWESEAAVADWLSGEEALRLSQLFRAARYGGVQWWTGEWRDTPERHSEAWSEKRPANPGGTEAQDMDSRDAYEATDPKHPDYHDTMADLADIDGAEHP